MQALYALGGPGIMIAENYGRNCFTMKTGKARLIIGLILAAAFCFAVLVPANAGIFDWFKGKKKAAPEAKEFLVVFPFDIGQSAKLPIEFGEDVASALRSMLTGNSQYVVFLYSDKLPPIKRAKDDNTLKTQDIDPPYSEDRTKAIKLGGILAGDFIMVGSIEDVNVDVASQTAQVTIAAELVNGKTGKLLKSFLITGRSPEFAKSSEEDELRALAAGDAVTKLKAEMLGDAIKNEGASATVADKTAAEPSKPVSNAANQ